MHLYPATINIFIFIEIRGIFRNFFIPLSFFKQSGIMYLIKALRVDYKLYYIICNWTLIFKNKINWFSRKSKNVEIYWDCWRYFQFTNWQVRCENIITGYSTVVHSITVQWGDGELPAGAQEWDRLPVRRGAGAGHHQAENNPETSQHTKGQLGSRLLLEALNHKWSQIKKWKKTKTLKFNLTN